MAQYATASRAFLTPARAPSRTDEWVYVIFDWDNLFASYLVSVAAFRVDERRGGACGLTLSLCVCVSSHWMRVTGRTRTSSRWCAARPLKASSQTLLRQVCLFLPPSPSPSLTPTPPHPHTHTHAQVRSRWTAPSR